MTVVGANTIAGRLVERLGRPVPGLRAFGLTHTFPAPEALAEADLHGLGLTGARARAVRSFAQAVAGDAVRLDGSVGLDELVASVTAIDGLGEWTAQYLALRLGERDACPTEDSGLRRALVSRLPRSELPFSAVADRWRPWRALAATHLWMSETARRAEAHAA